MYNQSKKNVSFLSGNVDNSEIIRATMQCFCVSLELFAKFFAICLKSPDL